MFRYEIIDAAEVATIEYAELPTKQARIIGMNSYYCNNITEGTTISDSLYSGIINDSASGTLTDTNYEIIYNGKNNRYISSAISSRNRR